MTLPALWPPGASGALAVLAPHPDDETLGCGFLMRQAAAAGARVVVIWLTDGGGSHGPLEAGARARLVERRRGEALAGLEALGGGVEAAETHVLGHPDGHLGDDPGRMDEAADRIGAICRAADVRVLVVTDGGDGHPDHRAAFAIARRVAVQARFSYPVSTRYDGAPYRPPANAILLPPRTGDAAAKRAALGRHASQSAAEGATYPMGADTIARFCADPEIFIPLPAGPA